MKTSVVLLALSLALSVSAAPQASQVADSFRRKGGFGNTGSGKNGGGSNNNNNNKNGGGAGNSNNNQNAGGAAAGGSSNSTNNANGGSAAGNNSTSTASGGSAAGSNSTSTGNSSDDPQTSLTLDPKVIASGFANNGQDVPTAGQVASLTSTNNFINFCLTVPNLPITNGQQIKTGSCNPAPMGIIPSTDNMPSSKFAFPANGQTIQANTEFTIKMNIQGMETGFFVNADENYFAAPQQINGQGQIQGHSHVVVETLSAIDSTTPSNPQTFAFFKGLNAAASGGQLTADVTNGLPAGVYKLSSINTAANHQPVLVPIAQHGSLDDAVYFTVTDDGQPDASSGALGGSNSTATGNTSAGNNSTAAGNTGAGNAGAGQTTNTGSSAGNANQNQNTNTGNAGQTQNGNTGNANQTQNGKTGTANQNQAGKGVQGSNQNQNNNNGGRGGRNRRFARSRF